MISTLISSTFPRLSINHSFEPSGADTEKCVHCGMLRGAHPEHYYYREDGRSRGKPESVEAKLAKAAASHP